MQEIVNTTEAFPKYIVNDEFSKEFKTLEIDEKFKHLSGRFLLVYGTKDDIDHMERAFEEDEDEVIRTDGSKTEKPNKEGFFDPALNWKGQYLYIPKNTTIETKEEGDHLIVNCYTQQKN